MNEDDVCVFDVIQFQFKLYEYKRLRSVSSHDLETFAYFAFTVMY